MSLEGWVMVIIGYVFSFYLGYIFAMDQVEEEKENGD